jgi:rod shape-determining protein MreC
MPPFEPDKIEARDRRALVLPIGFFLLSLVLLVLPMPVQQRVSSILRGSVLLPFIWTQESLNAARVRTRDLAALQSQFDSAIAALAAQRTLAEENDRLRGLLDLQGRAPPGFVGASALYSGTPGSEGMFLIDKGAEDGIEVNSPVVMADGLVGVVREVHARNSTVMDWTHPDFRVSAMTMDGGTFGIVEPRSGAFRGGGRLLLSSIPYHEPVETGALVVTSGGPGLLYPRGILIGRVAGLAESDAGDAGWRRSYWIEPAAYPGNATHVLVLTGASRAEEAAARTQNLWVPLAPDTVPPAPPGGVP